MIFSVAQMVNYYWDHESVYGKTIECGGMICEREMSSASDGKWLKKMMTECPMVENSKERMLLIIDTYNKSAHSDVGTGPCCCESLPLLKSLPPGQFDNDGKSVCHKTVNILRHSSCQWVITILPKSQQSPMKVQEWKFWNHSAITECKLTCLLRMITLYMPRVRFLILYIVLFLI